MFKAVLFDLDGTLLDTLTDLADAMNTALEQFGYSAHPMDAFKHFVGDSVETEARRALPESARDDQTVKKVAALSEVFYDKCWHKNTHPYPGIPQLLTELSKRNLPMAILSNKPDNFTKAMAQKLLPGWPFEIVKGALPDVPLKPDPTAALAIAKELNIPANQFLYIGDTNTDMKTAVNSGMFPLGVLWGFRPKQELLDNGAKALAKTPADILNFLDKN